MKMYVGNMSFDTTETQLEALFGEHGQVQSTAVITDRETGRPRGFGFVEMSDEDGRKAIAALNGKNVDGRDLNVSEARPRAESGGGNRSGGGGHRGW